jgi:hypothetical protein
MNTELTVLIRRIAGKLEVGQTDKVKMGGGVVPSAMTLLRKMGRARQTKFDSVYDGTYLIITRTPRPRSDVGDGEDMRESKYNFRSLRVGESMTVPASPRERDRVRQAAKGFARRHGWKLSCRSSITGMTVIRLDPEAVSSPNIPAQTRDIEWTPQPYKTKYPFDQLEIGESFVVPFEVEPMRVNLQQRCFYHGRRLGRKFSVTEIEPWRPTTPHRITRTA